jgi:hypothetical protein
LLCRAPVDYRGHTLLFDLHAVGKNVPCTDEELASIAASEPVANLIRVTEPYFLFHGADFWPAARVLPLSVID